MNQTAEKQNPVFYDNKDGVKSERLVYHVLSKEDETFEISSSSSSEL